MNNETVSMAVIATIKRNKDKDLRQRSAIIRDTLLSTDYRAVQTWFDRLINIDHAKLYGLGTEHHADREGGWGFADKDQKFLESLRMRFLGNAYGVTIGSGFCRIAPLTKNQLAALGRCIAKPHYTLQLALVHPE